MRERVAPDQIIDEALRIMTTAEKESDRLAAMVFLHGSGYIKPPAQLEIDASIAPAPPRTIDVTALPLPEQRQLLELLQRARAALPAGEGGES